MKTFFSEFWGLYLFVLLFVATASGVNGQKSVNFCSLFDLKNQGKAVTSKALMSYSTVGRVDGGDTFFYSADCNGPDYFAIPEGNSKVWGKSNRYFERLPSEKNLLLEITFEGKSDVATGRLFGSLDGWARARIILYRIISVKHVTETPGIAANWDTAKPEVERIEQIRVLLDIFLSSLFAPANTEKPVLDLLSDEFRFVDLIGKVFRKDQFAAIEAPWAGASAGMKESRTNRRLISSTSSTVTWRATFELVLHDESSRNYHCDITLVREGGKWIVRDAVMAI